ncbi:tyrosine protein phosphatase [bacterium]|jgi:protein-tyrosine phosphatase|nr:tyrosine protein phosphatase [bacterium]
MPEHHAIKMEFPGTLYICPRPRGHDWLLDELRGFQRVGIQNLVCLLTMDEKEELGLEREKQFCADLDIRFVHIPVDDRGLPDRYREFLGHSLSVLQWLHQDEKVAVHCRAGIGRSTMFCAAIMYFHGIYPEEALEIIESARGFPVPDTKQQREWILSIHKFSESLSDLELDLNGLPPGSRN